MRRPVRLLGPALAFLVAAVAGQAVDEPPAGQGEQARPRPSFDLDFEPPPGAEWTRGPDGREYFLEEIPLYEGHYQWENPERTVIRIVYGARYEVASIDDRAMTAKIKIYRPPPLAQRVTAAGPSAEERQRVEASYRIDPPVVDRLRFVALDSGLPRQGQWRNGFALADLDGNGTLDLAHGPPRRSSGRPVVFLGNGKGGFASWKTLRFPPSARFDYGDVAAADFNGDRVTDLALASHLLGVQVMVGDGKGRFEPWSEGIDFGSPGSGAFSSRALAAADWNGDGRTDLVAFGEGPRLTTAPGAATGENAVSPGSRGLRVFLNQGGGAWRRLDDPGSRNYGDDLAPADLDRDGRLDVLVSASVAGYVAILNLQQPDGSWRPTILPDLRPLALIHAVAVEDLDADGAQDLILSFTAEELGVKRSGVDIYLRRGGDRWERRSVYALPGGAGLTAVAVGDLDGDAALDLVALRGDGGSVVLLGDGRGGFALQASPALASESPGCRGYAVRVADLDGAGRPEIIAAFAGESDVAGRAMLGVTPVCASGGGLAIWAVETAVPAPSR